MKKNTQTILILGAVAVGLYMFKDKLSSAFNKGDAGDDGDDSDKGTQPASSSKSDENDEQPDAVVNIQRTGQTIQEGIETAKELASVLRDANIVIKTPDGQPNLRIKSGKKRKNTRRDRRKWLALQKLLKRDCNKIKSKRRKARCVTAQNKAKGMNLAMQSMFKRF